MAFAKCGLLVRFREEVEYVLAAVTVEVAAVAGAIALDAEDVGGWRGGVGVGVGDVAGDEGGR